MSCVVNLRDHLGSAQAGGTWTYLGGRPLFPNSTVYDPAFNPSFTPDLTGDNPSINFGGVLRGFYKFQYCGGDGNCADCEELIIQVLNSISVICQPVSASTQICLSDRGILPIGDALGFFPSGNCQIKNVENTGVDTIAPADIRWPFFNDVNLTSYPVGNYQLRFTIRDQFDAIYPYDCDDNCFVQVTWTITIVECEDCEITAGTPQETAICNDSATSILLRSRMTDANQGGTWTYLGYNASPGTPGAGGSMVPTLLGDNPQLIFIDFIPGYYYFQYCVTNDQIEDCEDCETLVIQVQECEDPCEDVSAGNPINLRICN